MRLLVATATLAALPALTAVTPAHATDECDGTTSNGHGHDSESGDCVHLEVYTAVDESIVVVYWGNQDYDFYQLRWSRPGRDETQRVRAWRGCVRELVGAEQRVVGHALHVQGAGLLQRVVRFGLHALERVDIRQGRPEHLGVGPGAGAHDVQHRPERGVSRLPLRDCSPVHR